ncbi:MAG: hypothetical protein AB1391_04240 [Candidatus Micrarchaeota archaeon]
MITMANRFKAFVSFDFLFSMIAILLIALYTIIFSSFLEARANEKIEQQILFDKLVSASNYVVKIGGAKTEGNSFPEKKRYPNLIILNDFESLEGKLGKFLHINLSIGFEAKQGTCIYRLVVYEPTNEIKKLYFCG